MLGPTLVYGPLARYCALIGTMSYFFSSDKRPIPKLRRKQW